MAHSWWLGFQSVPVNSINNLRRTQPKLIKLVRLDENSSFEALREKVSLLGEFQDILLKFHIFKIKFLHEKIIFFGPDFFPDKVWLVTVQKWTLQMNGIVRLRGWNPRKRRFLSKKNILRFLKKIIFRLKKSFFI